MKNKYRIFVDGAFLNGTDSYDYAMNRALGIALLFKLEFVNTKSKNVIDKWIGEKTVIITRNSV